MATRAAPTRSLDGARVLVTGASSGIGAATARLLGAHGARVALAGRDAAALASVARGPHPSFVGDLTDRVALATVVDGAVSSLGGLDGVVACAGAGWAGPFADMTPDELEATLDLNLTSTAQVVLRCLPALRRSPAAAIVMVGSIAGLLPVGGEAAYSAAKAGVAALGEALRQELAAEGISVSVVNPGVVDTAFFERRNRPYGRSRPRPIPAERVASAVVAALAGGPPVTVVPKWLAGPVRLRGALPGVYRALSDRFA